MPIQTTPLKLSVNCAKHGDKFYTNDSNKVCLACNFLVDYNSEVMKIAKRLEELNTQLEEFFKKNEVVAVEFGKSFMRGVL